MRLFIFRCGSSLLRLWTPRMFSLMLLLVVASTTTTTATTAPTHHHHRSSSWYSRYPFYPSYCSTPHQMAQRGIPPLILHHNNNNDDSPLSQSLIHVTAVIRHGARTPLTSHDCWNGFWDHPDTGVWNCDSTTTTATTAESYHVPQRHNHHHEHHHQALPILLVEKRYDALQSPLRNLLNGTCQVGQLLDKGYEQGLELGRQLRHAYLDPDPNHNNDSNNNNNSRDDDDDYDDTNRHHDQRLRLVYRDCRRTNKDDDGDPRWWLRVRSDDNPRTIMTAQALVTGLLGDNKKIEFDVQERPMKMHQENLHHRQHHYQHRIVAVHTADKSRDVLSKNTKLCPRLEQLKQEGEGSPDYQAVYTSSEAVLLRRLMKETLGRVMSNPTDCLMTTICNDRTLPTVVNDYRGERRGEEEEEHGEVFSNVMKTNRNKKDSNNTTDWDRKFGKDRFRRLVNLRTKLTSLYIQHNHAAFAKLATGPLWSDIRDHIVSALQAESESSATAATCPNVNRMAVFSAHDGTIMNLLSSLDVWGDLEWPPYASMMILEVYKLRNKDLSSSSSSRNQSSFAFRLIYNGQVRTSAIRNCPAGADLCHLQVLWDHLTPFATRSRNCTSTKTTVVKESNSNKPPHQPEWRFSSRTMSMLLFGIVGFGLGPILVCLQSNNDKRGS